ncbi:MAG: sigma-70 family RNA polymerase sigma factor [Acidobacteriaceae bacterium]|nr:sigma-70 family RNA polymerase sigma factor [Acidobacteriaceae bacterium]
MPRHKQALSCEFSDSYVSGLRNGNPEIQNHFASYFGGAVDFWLRFRLRDHTAIEDLRQETLCRVLEAIKREKSLRDANRLGQFVNGICRNVLFEHWRATQRTTELDECLGSWDEASGPEQSLQTEESLCQLRTAMMSLPEYDRAVLLMLYFDELDRSEVSERLGVKRGHLRVLVHRAISRLRESFISCACK